MHWTYSFFQFCQLFLLLPAHENARYAYWVIKLSFCFHLIPFPENSLFSVHITNVTSTNFWKKKKKKKKKKRSCVSIWVCFAPTMPNVGSRYSKFGFEKKKCIWFWKKTTTKNCWGSIHGFHLSDKKNVYLWTLDYGSGMAGEALRLFYGKRELAILKTCFDSIGTEELFTNVHEPTETMPYFLFTLLYVSPSSLIFTHLIQMITDIHV